MCKEQRFVLPIKLCFKGFRPRLADSSFLDFGERVCHSGRAQQSRSLTSLPGRGWAGTNETFSGTHQLPAFSGPPLPFPTVPLPRDQNFTTLALKDISDSNYKNTFLCSLTNIYSEPTVCYILFLGRVIKRWI